jgi:DNA-binding response OmpR family regulator
MADAWIYIDPDDPGTAAEIARELAELGFSPRLIATNGYGSLAPDGRDGAASRRPELAIVLSDPSLSRRLSADDELGDVPVLVALDPSRLADAGAVSAGHELVLRPLRPGELRVRVARLRNAVSGIGPADVVRVADLEIDVATHQIAVGGRPLDFTNIEYELLKFLVTHPGRVFTREALLSRVWGYDYYGGVRTVDVHVRRVRAKLGAEHAGRIRTVRGVGYRYDTHSQQSRHRPETKAA